MARVSCTPYNHVWTRIHLSSFRCRWLLGRALTSPVAYAMLVFRKGQRIRYLVGDFGCSHVNDTMKYMKFQDFNHIHS